MNDHPRESAEDEPRMSRERFEAWADEIGLTNEQRDRVLYVIRREWDRGRASAGKAQYGQKERGSGE